MSQIALFDHLDRLRGRFLDVVLENRYAEFLGHRLDRGEIEGLGHRGDDALEEEALDDLGAFDAQLVRELLHREVAFRHHEHFGPLLLGFPGSPQLHGAAALTLAGGFLATLASDNGRLGLCRASATGFGRTGQGGLQHHRIGVTGVATGLCRQGIVVLTNDVNALALLLG